MGAVYPHMCVQQTSHVEVGRKSLLTGKSPAPSVPGPFALWARKGAHMNTTTCTNTYRTHFDALCLACALAFVATVLIGAL
jgi:hypothetical protein